MRSRIRPFRTYRQSWAHLCFLAIILPLDPSGSWHWDWSNQYHPHSPHRLLAVQTLSRHASSVTTMAFARGVTIALLMISILASAEADGPVDVPDEVGLGERLALVAWLSEHSIQVVNPHDLVAMRAAYRKATRPSEPAPDPAASIEADQLKTQLWVRHNRSVTGNPSIAELRTLIAQLDAASEERERIQAAARPPPLIPRPQPVDSTPKEKPTHPTTAITAKTSPTTSTATSSQPIISAPPEAWITGTSEASITYRLLQAEYIDPLLRRSGPVPVWKDDAQLFLVCELARNVDTLLAQCIPPCTSLGQRLVAAGCDDPGFLACCLLQHPGLLKDPDRVLNALEQGGYSLRLRAACARKLATDSYRENATQTDRHLEFVRKTGELYIKLLHTKTDNPRLISLLAGQIGQGLSTFRPRPYHLEWLESCISEIERHEGFPDEIHPWLAAMIRGQYELMKAWMARGNGTAVHVTEAGWEGFRHHSNAARQYFETAWQLDTMQPLAASMRIAVAMGTSEGDDVIWLWLDRAIAIHPDHMPAYELALEAFSPQWGGSPQKAGQVRLRAARTNAFDGPGPFVSLCSADATPVLRGYMESRAYAPYRTWFLHKIIAWAYDYQHSEAAVAALADLGGKPDVKVLDQLLGSSRRQQAIDLYAEALAVEMKLRAEQK
jgi:hypothetical protein